MKNDNASKPSKRFYVYILVDGEAPFYVGKGQQKRAYTHRNEARRGHACHKCNKIRKLWREGRDYVERIVFETNNEQDAFDKEVALIAEIGSRNLCNLTAGGEGATTAEHIAKEYEARMRLNINEYKLVEESTRSQVDFEFRQKLKQVDEVLRAERKRIRDAKKMGASVDLTLKF